MFTIAIANQKGGVGKTTTAVTLGAALAAKGTNTLLCDLDPQGHVAFSLGLEKNSAIYRWLTKSAPLNDVISQARPNLAAIVGDKQTEAAKRYITALDFRERVIASALRQASDYDVTILDLAPSLDVLHVAALVAADYVIIPTRLDALSIDGVRDLLASMVQISRAGYPIRGYAIVPTFFDRTTKETMVQFQDLVAAFPKNIWPPIPQDTKAREATAYGQTILEYSPTSPAAVGYLTKGKRIGGYLDTIERLQKVIANGQ